MITTQKLLKILLVEDNPDDVLLIKIALEKEGLKNEMFIARDGEQAVDFLNKEGELRKLLPQN